MGVMLSEAEMGEAAAYSRGYEAARRCAYVRGFVAGRHATVLAVRRRAAGSAAAAVALVEAIQQETAARFGLTVAALIGSATRRGVAEPRHLACALSVRLAGVSQAQAGRLFGGRDPTTTIYALRRFDALAAADPAWREAARAIAQAVGRGAEFDAIGEGRP